MEFLLAASEPVSMEDTVARCGDAAGDPATVYRNLQALAAAGVVHSLRGVGRREMFELAHGHRHAHLTCTRCGRVACTTPPVKVGAPHESGGWQIQEVSVTLWGLCPDCRKA
ncbi:MAG: transcriptional repressor [Planctomycetes bacterium]|nr:transcriptional repressor [Planctomycetota bacterium]